MYKKYIISLSTLVVLFSGCANQTPYTKRNQLILVSQEKELALGEQNYEQVLKESKVVTGTKDANRIKAIGQRIAKVANKPDYKWEFNLVQSDEINAFCLPGGKVVVYTGILKIAQNDDQLATVMSHEIAHALARHGAERMTTSMIQQGVGMAGQVAVGVAAPEYSNVFSQAYGVGSNLAVALPYGRMQESEADEIGIYLMDKAGYNLNEALKFWENMSKNSNSKTIEFLSTHPSHETRIKDIQALIKKIQSQKS